MDFIVKFTIGLFIFSLFLLFFKSTKSLTKNYQKKSYFDLNKIITEEIDEKNRFDPNLPRNFLQNPDDIIWKINN